MTQENLLARYSVINEIDRGGLARVYAARDRETGAIVALKRLDPALGQSDASLAQRFVKLAQAARRLRHESIVQVHSAWEAAGTAYVAMEMVEGRSLRRVLDEGPLPLGRALRIAHDVARTLEYAHLQGVVHGGLNPSNILVTPSGAVKIIDFGTGQLAKGAAGYASPEQLRGGPVDHRSDLYSLGAVMYEMLAQRPLQGTSPQRPSELNPIVPPGLDAIVLGLLAPEPAARVAGAPILLRDLQRFEEAVGLETTMKQEEPTAGLQTPDHRISDPDAIEFQEAIALMERESKIERRSGPRPAAFAALALLVALIGIGFAGAWYYSPQLADRGIAAVRDIAAAVRPAPPVLPPVISRSTLAGGPEASKAPEATKAPERVPAPPQAAPPPVAAAPVAVAAEQESKPLAAVEPPAPEPAPAPPPAAAPDPAPAPEPEPRPAIQPTPKVAEKPRPVGTAKLIVAVSPAGELYIDGTHHGSTPPMTTFELQPGLHRIEVRNPARKPYVTYMTVEPGEVRRITHDFNATLRPPS